MPTDEFAKVIRATTSFHETPVDHRSIGVPTLVLYGEHEPGFLRRQAAKLGDSIPGATVRAAPGAAHASNLDAPEFFTDQLRSFLASVAATGADGT